MALLGVFATVAKLGPSKSRQAGDFRLDRLLLQPFKASENAAVQAWLMALFCL